MSFKFDSAFSVKMFSWRAIPQLDIVEFKKKKN